jgi:DUF971 family protein
LKPLSIKRDGAGLRVAWSDGVIAFVPFRTLRQSCPCATCNAERVKPPDPFRVLKASEVAAGDPVPAAMRPVGHYAYQITWNDGHDAGIYPLETLRRHGESPPES